MSIFSIPPLISAILVLGLGTFVYLKDRRDVVNISFALFSLSIFFWLIGYTIVYSTEDKIMAMFFSRFAYIGIVYLPATFYHFTVSFLKLNRKKIVNFLYLSSFLFLILSQTTFFLSEVRRYFWGYYPYKGPMYPLYTIFFVGVFITCLILLWNGYRNKSGVRPPTECQRIRYVFIGIVIALLGSVDFLGKYGIVIYPFGYATTLAWAAIIAYAIVAHRLMDINVIITKGLAYGTLTMAIAGVYVGLMAGLDRVFAGVSGYNPTLVHGFLFVAVFFALIYVLPQMKIRALEITRRTLFRGKYDYQQELSEATRVIPTMLNLEKLGNYILTKIRDTMMVDKLSLCVYDNDEHAYRALASFGLDKDAVAKVKFGENSPLAALLRGARTPLVKEELERQGTVPEEAMYMAVEQLIILGAELCVPLMLKDDLTGILTLSNKKSGEMYTEEDITLLTALANQVALTIEYIRAIDTITSEKRYVGLGKAAMRMAHDIKNPLVPLKTFLQILPDKYPHEFAEMSKIDKEFTGRFYESALEGVDRINNLIERALHYARHPEPQFSPVKLDKLLNDVLTEEEGKLKENNIQLRKEYDPDGNSIDADGEQLMELFSNLISNGIDAMEESAARKLTIKTQAFNGRISVEVIDTGCGIPKDRIDSIFDPFITYKHQGSGLGLAIAKKIVDDHRGSIEVSSTPDKGSTFKVILPTKQRKG